MAKDLLSDASASDDDANDRGHDLRVNRSFATKFERQKRAQELARAKELLEEDGEDSETSESEDEEADLLDPSLDLQIINTINMIKKKDPKIYDKQTKWFSATEGAESESESEEEEDERKGAKKSKKKTFKEIAQEQLLEGGDDSDDEARNPRDKSAMKTSQLLYDGEQEAARRAFLTAVRGDGEGDDDDDMLQVKARTPREQEEENRKIQLALDEMKSLAMQEETSKAEQIEFLTNYMSKKLWKQPVVLHAEEDDEDDEEELDKADLFESKYNFRFEELADQQRQVEDATARGDLRSKVAFDLSTQQGAQVMGHARNVADSLRRVDDTRKQEREARKERKEREKRQKEAEIRRLKNIKRQELQDRIKKISDFGGLHDIQIDESLLDEDWDPAKHEQMMQQQFGDDYYGQEDDFEVDEELGDAVARELGDEELGYEHEGHDEAYDDEEEGYGEEEVDMEAEKSAIKTLQDDLYKLDYEDLVAGMPCRFKYRTVAAEDFGLSTEDILLADDTELNRYVSLKKLAPYDTRKKWDEEQLSKKRKRLRQTVKERKAELLAEEARREELRAKSLEGQAAHAHAHAQAKAKEVTTGDEKKRRRRRKHQAGSEEGAEDNADADVGGDDVEAAPGLSAEVAIPDKKPKKAKKAKKAKKEETDPLKKRLALYK